MAEPIKDHLYVLIICGGGGTRLWPRSSQKTPKQFLPNFFGEETLFSQTVERAQWLTSSEKIFVVTVGDYVDEVIQQGKVIPSRNIIAEPEGKNTALAMGVGAAYIKKIDPQAVIINFASDHLIGDKEIFIKCMMLAAEAAYKSNYLVTVGIKPTFPHTGLGYIEMGEVSEIIPGVFKAKSFKEKPDLGAAKGFLASGQYLWNANLYVWSVESIFKAFLQSSPKISEILEKIFNSFGTENERKVMEEVYKGAENVSIDYAISEKVTNLFLVPGTFSWSDIGDWKTVYDLKQKDDDGNIIECFGKNGWHLGVETKNTLVETENRLVTTVGVSDLIIIETEKAILVCAKDKAQEVKKIVNFLKEKEKKEFL